MDERKKTGRFYGVGVGAGDPEDITLRAIRVFQKCQVIGMQESKTAYDIAGQACLEADIIIEEKEKLFLSLPMSRDEEALKRAWRKAAGQIAEKLVEGKDVALPVLGDPTIYASVGYLKEELDRAGFETSLVNGIPSFVRAASDAGISLVQGKEALHIFPGISGAEEALRFSGTRVFMKTGKELNRLRNGLEQILWEAQQHGEKEPEIYCVEKAGWKEKSLKIGQDALNGENGYYTLVIVKQGRES